ncbi:MAG: Asp-tRNA(Asn)/Glu-tRNA(Gln) amidotransferase subunit GatA [bacterium]
MSLYELTAHQLHELLISRQISACEILDETIKRIEQVEPDVHGYLCYTFDTGMEQAKKVDEMINRGEDIHPLAGIPVAVKDNICTKSIPTTCASKILNGFKPPYNATVIEGLQKANMVIIGKTNMDEFAMGSSTENSAFGPTRNPRDLQRAPGGSSGGSAAVVASCEATLAIGSDTGGSIRQPASFCGVVGMKPTYGLISRYGLIAFASSLDQIGPLSKDVRDCALLLNVLAGYDTRDSTSINIAIPDYTQFLTNDIAGMKIGIPKEYFCEGLDPGVEKRIQDAISMFTELGAECVDISLPHTEYAIAVYYILATSEASSNLARYDGVQYGYRAEEAESLLDMYRLTRSNGFGPEVKRRIMLGTYALSSGYYDAYYLQAQRVRTLIKNDFEEGFKKCDVMLTPTSPTVAFKLGERIDDPLKMYLSDIFTISANLAGIPGISIPCGLSDGLPVGLQLLGPVFGEGKILQAAYAYETEADSCVCP